MLRPPLLALSLVLLLAGCSSTPRNNDSADANWTPEEYYELAQIYYQRGLLDPAEKEFRMAVSIRADYPEALCGLGYVYHQKGNIEGQKKDAKQMDWYHNLSRKYFMLALEKKSYAEPHYGLGILYFDRSKVDESLEEFETYVHADPKRGETHFYLGALYSVRERYQEALDSYRNYLEINPTPPNSAELYDTIERLEQLVSEGKGLPAEPHRVAKHMPAPPACAPTKKAP